MTRTLRYAPASTPGGGGAAAPPGRPPPPPPPPPLHPPPPATPAAPPPPPPPPRFAFRRQSSVKTISVVTPDMVALNFRDFKSRRLSH
jgi:hypothetical protein